MSQNETSWKFMKTKNALFLSRVLLFVGLECLHCSKGIQKKIFYLILKNETLWKDMSLDGRKTKGSWTKLQKFSLVVSDNFLSVMVDWHLVDFKISWYKPNGMGVSKAKRILFSISFTSCQLRKPRYWYLGGISEIDSYFYWFY